MTAKEKSYFPLDHRIFVVRFIIHKHKRNGRAAIDGECRMRERKRETCLYVNDDVLTQMCFRLNQF